MGWDPDRYLTFADERGRPFVELLARVGADSPATVVDLGCGPGNLTALLLRRWPSASVEGLDSSAEMVERARRDVPGIDFRVADLREWIAGSGQVDVLLSNATLQWVPGHLELLPELVARVADGGWFAFQVPNNHGHPSHEIRHELAAEEPYAEHTVDVAAPLSHEPERYLDALAGTGCEVDVWESTYFHVLSGPDPVFEWKAGTGARPTVEALPPELRPKFEKEFKRRLAAAYPARDDGSVVLPFRRVFAVAHRSLVE